MKHVCLQDDVQMSILVDVTIVVHFGKKCDLKISFVSLASVIPLLGTICRQNLISEPTSLKAKP